MTPPAPPATPARLQRPAHQLSRLGRGRRPADRVRARLHVERPGVQWAASARIGSSTSRRPRCARPWRERVVARRRLPVPGSGRRSGRARRRARAGTIHPDRNFDGRDHRDGLRRCTSGPAAATGPQRHRARHRNRNQRIARPRRWGADRRSSPVRSTRRWNTAARSPPSPPAGSWRIDQREEPHWVCFVSDRTGAGSGRWIQPTSGRHA